MKNILKALICSLILFQSAVAQVSVKVMNYNVHNAIGNDGVVDYQRTANAILKHSPDIVTIQEVDSVTTRSGGINVMKELGSLCVMHHAFAKAIDHQGGAYGIGILSKKKPISMRVIPLPGKEEKRAAIVAEFEDYVVCNTHFSLTQESRAEAMEIIKESLSKESKPVILAGDFNATPDSPEIASILEDYQSLLDTKLPTYPAESPDVCIDYIFGQTSNGNSYVTTEAKVIEDSITSDHRPLVANILLPLAEKDIFRTLPYLQNPVDNGITIAWLTNTKTHSWVEYGTDTTNMKKERTIVDGQVICNNYIHKIRLNNIERGKKYHYRICSQEILHYGAYSKTFGNTAVSPYYSFELPKEDEENFTALVYNDTHQRIETLEALHKNAENIDYDFVVFNGDCIDDPYAEGQAVSSISKHNKIVDASNKPVFYLRGNHEIRGAYSIGLRDLFDYVDNRTYGAFNWGDTRIVMLDCGEDKPDDHWVYYNLNDFTKLRNDQVTFLEEELKSKAFKKASKRLLIHHIPIYGNSDKYQPCTELWQPLLKNAPFDASLNGHTHAYKYHPKGSKGNNFPVFIGGGHKLDGATMMIVEKKGKRMDIKVMNAEGKVIEQYTSGL